MLKNISDKHFINKFLSKCLSNYPFSLISKKQFTINNRIIDYQLINTKNIKPTPNSNKIQFSSKNKFEFSALNKKSFCAKSNKNADKSIDLKDDNFLNKKKIVKELELLFNDLKPDFNDKDNILNFINLCANINQNEFLTEEIFLKFIEEIFKNKTEAAFTDDNLEVLVEILTKIFNVENDFCHGKWNEFLDYLGIHKSRIDFNCLINKILDRVDKSIVQLNKLTTSNNSNNDSNNSSASPEAAKKSLKNAFFNKVFDAFVLENIFEIQKFSACNYNEAKLLIKLYTPQFIERNPEILQTLLNNIFTIYQNEVFNHNLKEFIELSDFLLHKHNFYYFCSILSKQTQNITKLIPSSSITEIISILSFHKLLMMEYSSLMGESELSEFENQLIKLLQTVEKEVMHEMNNIEIKEFLILLDHLTLLHYDSPDFYSDVFDYFENVIQDKNQSKIPANYFYMLLDVYCRTNLNKPKFVDLLVERLREAIPNVKAENLSNFLRILFSLDSKKVEILNEVEGFITEQLGKVDDVAFANFVFAFCNKEYKKQEIFGKLEEEAFIRLDKMSQSENWDSIIDVLYNFIYSKKTSSFIHNIIKDKLLKDVNKIEKIHAQSALKVFNIFEELGVKYPSSSGFDYFLCVNAHEFDKNDMQELNEILLSLNYKGSKFYEFFLKCLEIENPYERIDLANRFVMENMSK